MYHPTRGGARGGAAEFSWDKVKESKDREFYLGNSVAAPTGRWQDGRDINWYNKAESSSAADERREELKRIKEAEMFEMYRKLGRDPPVKGAEGGLVGERLASGSSGAGRREATGANSEVLEAGRKKWGPGEREGEGEGGGEVSEADKKLARKFARDEVGRRRKEAGEEDQERSRRSSRHDRDETDRDRHRHRGHHHKSSRFRDEERETKDSRRHRQHKEDDRDGRHRRGDDRENRDRRRSDRSRSRSRSRSPASSSRHRRRQDEKELHRSKNSPSWVEREDRRNESRHNHSSHHRRNRDPDHASRSP